MVDEVRKYRVDLHNHTPLIPMDYKGSLETSGLDIVQAAIDAGIDVLAISDHFSVDFFRAVHGAAHDVHVATGRKLLVIPGAELKITWMGEEIHLITLFQPDLAEENFEELMVFLGVSSSDRKLENLPMVTVEIDPAIAIEKVRAMGGLCHIAHIDRFFGDYRLMDSPIIDRLITETQICAIEVIDKKNSEILKARTNSIPHIHSSDSHSTEEIGRRYAELCMHDLSFESLKTALTSAPDSKAAAS